MAKKELTKDEIVNLKTRPSFRLGTLKEMEARWKNEESRYAPVEFLVDGRKQLHVKCEACGQHGQAATMEMGHIVAWKKFILDRMDYHKVGVISNTDFHDLFNSQENLRWEHALCNGGHIFEKGDPFALTNGDEKKIAWLKRCKVVQESGLNDTQIGELTPAEFVQIGNAKLAPLDGDVINTQEYTGKDSQKINVAETGIDFGSTDPEFDLNKLKRNQLGWYPNTRKALFLKWKKEGNTKIIDGHTYLRCGSCLNFTEGSCMDRGHKQVWKVHLERLGVTNLIQAKIGYNDLNNLRFECSKCNRGHDFENLSKDEQDALDNALYRVSVDSDVDDESLLMRTLVFGDLTSVPDDLPIDGDLMRRIQAFAEKQGSMNLLTEMAKRMAVQLDCEQRAVIEQEKYITACLDKEMLENEFREVQYNMHLLQKEHDLASEDRKQSYVELRRAERSQNPMEGESQYKSDIISTEEYKEQKKRADQLFKEYQQNTASANAIKQEIEARELELNSLRQQIGRQEQLVSEAIYDCKNADAGLEEAEHNVANWREGTADTREMSKDEAQRISDDDETYFLLRGAMTDSQKDVLKLMQMATRVVQEAGKATLKDIKASMQTAIDLAREFGGMDYQSLEFGDAKKCAELVGKAHYLAHYKKMEGTNKPLKKKPEITLTCGSEDVDIDVMYSYMIEVKRSGKTPEDLKRAFLEALVMNSGRQ